MSTPDFDPGQEAVDKAIEEREGALDDMYSTTHLDKGERRDIADEWEANAESEAEFLSGLPEIVKRDIAEATRQPELTPKEKAAKEKADAKAAADAQHRAIEESWQSVSELEPDAEYILDAISNGELHDLDPAERLTALSRVDVAETRVLADDHAGALEALGGDKELLAYLLTERLDEDDAGGFAQFVVEAAAELEEDLQAQAYDETREVVDANPILQEGRGAQLLASALAEVQLPRNPGEQRAFVEGIARMAKEEARVERLGQFHGAFEQALSPSQRAQPGREIWGDPAPQPDMLVPDYEAAFRNEPDPQDVALADGLAELEAMAERDREWNETMQSVRDRHEREKAEEILRRPGR